MAMSGIDIDSEVKTLYDEIKLKNSSERIKIVLMKIDSKSVKVTQKITSSELSGDDALSKLFQALHENECCYVLYDCCYETNETQKDELVFIQWCPDTAKIKDKMVYAATAQAVKKVFNGCKHFWEMTDNEQKHPHWFKDQLGTCTNHVKVLEGKQV